MTDPIIFEATPVDIHRDVQDNEIQNLQSINSRLDLTELEKFVGLNVVSRNSDRNLDSVDDHCLSPTSDKLLTSKFGYLWRKYGVGNEEKCGCENTPRGQSVGPHEMAVHGMHVDERVLPGFKYHVRILSQRRNDCYQFGGEALHLTHIGKGYGKRLTFESDCANINPNFFWSDSHPNGYAFIISAIRPGDKFVLCRQNRRPIGHATVVASSRHQVEIGSAVDGEDVAKKVIVAMRITVRYTSERHGMMSLRPDEMVDAMGVAVVTKTAGKSRAVTKCIEDVEIPGHGECLLYKDED